MKVKPVKKLFLSTIDLHFPLAEYGNIVLKIVPELGQSHQKVVPDAAR